jgi:hypothetical protein
MSSIKPKKGQCIDCTPDAPEQYLTAKRCKTHYWQHRSSLSASKPVKTDKNAQKKALDLWFANQIKVMPKQCENCNEYLNPYAPWGARAYVAHILPKRLFDSVKIHPMNRMFLCIHCHTDFDNKGEQYALRMPALPIILERFMQFLHNIHNDELRLLPNYLAEVYENI